MSENPRRRGRVPKWPEKTASDLPFDLAHKFEAWEKRLDARKPEKERESTKWPEKAANDLPFAPGLKFKAKAGKAREAVKEKTQEKETHASSAKTRDRGAQKGWQ
jgi:hypothetical protein